MVLERMGVRGMRKAGCLRWCVCTAGYPCLGQVEEFFEKVHRMNAAVQLV